MKPLTLAGIGCGGRTRTYFRLAARQPHRYRMIAAADPNPTRLEMTREVSRNPDLRLFESDKALLAAGRLADVMVIGTQDAYHVEPCIRAMEIGYDVMLEKPIATNIREVLALDQKARELGRRVLVCHVLRYTPFYERVKGIIDSGELGEIASLDASEGVGTWHHAHSFVRGHWSNTGRCTPMIIAKSCHDTDIISWLIGRECLSVSSFGSLEFYRASNAPAGAPKRCTDGCPVDRTCPFNAMRYATVEKGWLGHVYDQAQSATDEQIRDWLSASPWGRCVYHCDNDAVDRQVLAMKFSGGITATFTMTAFDDGRNLTIYGTNAVLRGGSATKRASGHDIAIHYHDGRRALMDVVSRDEGYAGHGGGDGGLVSALADEFAKPDPQQMRSNLSASVQSHLIGFAAEESRLTGRTVDLAEFRRRNLSA